MEIKHHAISQKQWRLPIVGRWFKAKNYNLYLCDLSVPMFDLNFMLCFGSTEDFSRYVRDRADYIVNYDNAAALYVRCQEKDKKWSHYILLTSNEWRAKDYGTIAHELHHAVHLSLENIGLDYGRGGEELFAYMQGHMMELVVRAFQELKKAQRKKVSKKKKRHAHRK